MVTYKKYVLEALGYMDTSKGRRLTIGPSGKSSTTTSTRSPVSTIRPPAPVAAAAPTAMAAPATVAAAPSIAPSASTTPMPRTQPAVTTRNVPSTAGTISGAGKNGQLQPSELVRVGKYQAGPSGQSQWYKNDAYLAPDAARAFQRAQQEYGKPIQINSAYRNLEHQKGLSREGHRVVARSGTSRHGLGKALDLQNGTSAYNWMKANGPKYGWHYAAISGDPYHFEYKG